MLRGRDDECRAVRNLLDGVTDGGGALLLRGEPGSGRTALVDYAHRSAEHCTVLAATGLAEEAALPYAGLQRLLDPVLGRATALPDAAAVPAQPPHRAGRGHRPGRRRRPAHR